MSNVDGSRESRIDYRAAMLAQDVLPFKLKNTRYLLQKRKMTRPTSQPVLQDGKRQLELYCTDELLTEGCSLLETAERTKLRPAACINTL